MACSIKPIFVVNVCTIYIDVCAAAAAAVIIAITTTTAAAAVGTILCIRGERGERERERKVNHITSRWSSE
jgi:hypothetical protein